MRAIRNAAAALALTTACSVAYAVPSLQLGIAGGTYDTTTETIVASTNPFSLYAFSLSSTGTYRLSIALQPATSTGGNYGSFSVDGTTYDVTADMLYGVPPIEAMIAHDGGDLGPHDVFPTYFLEIEFSFDPNAKASFCSGSNTQDCPSLSGLTTGTTGDVFYKMFNVDVSGLDAGYYLHFDLYNTKLGQTTGDIDINDFAPFSHDAQSSSSRITSSATPAGASSSSLVALGLGLLGFGFMRRRRQGV